MKIKEVKIDKIRRGSLIVCGDYGIQEVVHIYEDEIVTMAGVHMILKPDETIKRVKY